MKKKAGTLSRDSAAGRKKRPKGRLIYSRSGGMTGGRRECELSLTALDDRTWETLTGLLRHGSRRSGPRPSRDLQLYRIEVQAGGRKKVLVFDDLSLPPAVAPFLAFLESRATPLGIDKKMFRV